MSTLPFDYARCPGTTHVACQVCRRRDPGRAEWQSYMQPPIDMLTGQCPEFIGHQTTTSKATGATA